MCVCMHKRVWLGALYTADTKVWAGVQMWKARDRVLRWPLSHPCRAIDLRAQLQSLRRQLEQVTQKGRTRRVQSAELSRELCKAHRWDSAWLSLLREAAGKPTAIGFCPARFCPSSARHLPPLLLSALWPWPSGEPTGSRKSNAGNWSSRWLGCRLSRQKSWQC